MNFSLNSKQTVLVYSDYKIYKNMTPLKNVKFAKNMSEELTLNQAHELLVDATLKSDKVSKWLEYRFNKTKKVIEEDKRILSRAISENNKYDTYFLNEALGLYTEMAKVNPFIDNDIIGFCKFFGIPIGIDTLDDIDYFYTIGQDEKAISFQYVQLNYLQKAFIEYLYIFDVFKNIVLSDIEAILNRDELTRKVYKEMNYNDEYVLNEEKEYFNHLINSFDFSRLNLKYHEANDTNGFQLNMYHVNLIEYAIFQMVNALIQGSSFKYCNNCGHIFEVTHEKMKFCPPLPFRKRSSCEMAYRNKSRKK